MNCSKNISFDLKPAGGPFHDPAVLVSEPNQRDHLLLDCGTLHGLKTRDLLRVRWLFLSHLHIDHLIGFDHLLRLRLFSDLPLTVFGPPGTTRAIGHRLLGYAWNLTGGSPFVVESVDLPLGGETQDSQTEHLDRGKFRCDNQFEKELLSSDIPYPVTSKDVLKLSETLTVRWHSVKHGVACLCFLLTKSLPPKFSLENCRRLGLEPGPWVKRLTAGERVELLVGAENRDETWLRSEMVTDREPEKLGYLTDTMLDEHLMGELADFFHKVDILMSETAYRRSESEIARQNLHMTTGQVADLANRAAAKKLLIFHLSRRHSADGPGQHLEEVRSVFPESHLLKGG